MQLPRGVIKSWATDEVSTEPDDPKFGPVGKQRIEDTGPLTKKRMETIDDETTEACIDFIKRQHEADTPFFVWMNMTHMHLRTHTKPESIGQAGLWQSPYHDTMIDHDRNVGQVLDALDELGIADDTIVIYSTDNGPHANTLARRRDDAVPQREEHQLGGRIPDSGDDPLARQDQAAGIVSNEIIQHHDWLPTFLAAAGEPDIIDKLKKGHKVGDTKYKVHIDGFNLLPYLTGEVDESPRKGFIYFSDDCDVLGIRFRQLEGRVQGAALPGHAADLVRAVHPAAGTEDCSICAPIRSSAPTSRRTRTATGCSTTTTSCSTRPRSSRSSWRRSRSSRRGRSRRRSRSTMPFESCKSSWRSD